MNASQIFANWKTSVQSILTAVISLSLVAPSLAILTPKQVAVIVAAGAIAKIVLGLAQQDAGIQTPKP